MSNLTITDIHNIREEHAASTRGMSFDEYKANLRKEITPLLSLLQAMKSERKTPTSYTTTIEPSIAAEPQFPYKTKKNNQQ